MARLFLLAAVLAVSAISVHALGKKKWDNVDWDKAEKDLEQGDDPELLETEDAAMAREFERRRNQGLQKPEDVKLKDPSEWLRHSSAMAGPAMMFATLKPRPQGWDKKSLEELTQKWRELLKTAGLDAQCYDIGEGRVLLTMQSGWRGYELRDFVLAQEDSVEELEWDQVKYKPGEFLDHEVDAARHPGAAPLDDALTKLMGKKDDKPDTGKKPKKDRKGRSSAEAQGIPKSAKSKKAPVVTDHTGKVHEGMKINIKTDEDEL